MSFDISKIEVPQKCLNCKCVGEYTKGPFSRNPHYCCELIWQLFEEDYRVDPNTRDKNCPLEQIKTN